MVVALAWMSNCVEYISRLEGFKSIKQQELVVIQDGVSKKGFPDIATSTIYKALVDEHEYFDIPYFLI